jgi:hypothetical protein
MKARKHGASDRLTLARSPASHRRLAACQARRLSLLTVDANEARRLKEDDPAVQAGLYEIEVDPSDGPERRPAVRPGDVPPLDGAS